MNTKLILKTVIPAAVVLTATLLGSCAYFNTLYNARKIYSEAEKSRIEREGEVDRNLKEKYNQVIEKCGKVIRDYPDSRWVDDAVFLMGQSLVRQEEYDKGIRKFIELTTNYPESGYVPNSLYWLAKANYMKGEYNQALLYTERFLEAYPKNDLKYEVIFLAGDIDLALRDFDGALENYSRVASESGDKRYQEDASLKSAELYYRMEDWQKAAEGFESVLQKGMSWDREYSISLSLADCYTKTGRCAEALELSDGLLERIITTKEKPAVLLERAASFVCMDSLSKAVDEYRNIATSFPRSLYSAEAYFHLGVIYQERLDSLQQAQEAYAKVSNESASSEYATVALQRSSSLRRLIELESGAGENEGEEAKAEKKFLAAEIQLTRLGEIDQALKNYSAVIDTFPGTDYAPMAAYAIAYIYRSEKKDTAQALDAFTRLVRMYPVSPQARGALYDIEMLGEEALSRELEAYVDSAAADTSGASSRTGTAAAGGAAVPVKADTTAVPSRADTTTAGEAAVPVKADTTAVPSRADTTTADTTAAGTDALPSRADTTSSGAAKADSTRKPPSKEEVKKETTYPLGGESDTSRAKGGQPGDNSPSERPERREKG